jgi:hypothetical protein
MNAAREELGTIGVLGTLLDGTKVAGCLLSFCGPLEDSAAQGSQHTAAGPGGADALYGGPEHS